MNNTFNINRFGLLIRKQWLEYGKLYLIVLGIVAGVTLAIYGYFYWQITLLNQQPPPSYLLASDFRWPLFYIFGILFLSLSANHYFAPLAQKPKAILELTLPASSLEKYLTGILYTAIFALVGYLLIFYLIDVVFVSKLRVDFPGQLANLNNENSRNLKVPEYLFNRIFTGPEQTILGITSPFILMGIFTLGSLFFKKFQYLKTLISALAFTAILFTTLGYSGKWIFDNKITINNDSNWGYSHIQLQCLILGVLLFVAVVTYFIAYIRFKEKEV